MVPEDENASSAEDTLRTDDVPSVPSTQRGLDLMAKGKKEEGVEDGGPADAVKKSTMVGSKNGEGGGEGGGTTRPRLVQKEAGIGPVRILRRKPHIVPGGGGGNADDGVEQQPTVSGARIVQRQETSGGGAFRVILNVRLEPISCTFHRRGDKFLQLNSLNNLGVIESFLLKVKTTADADTLESILSDVLEAWP
jgi:hypothetical protein